MDSDHESADCPDARIPGHHICRNCKDKKGFKTHNAGEKTNKLWLNFTFFLGVKLKNPARGQVYRVSWENIGQRHFTQQ